MILIKNIILIFLGLTSGAAVAAGVFAFITMIGVVTRLASRTGTAKYLYLYETAVVLGGTLGNIMIMFNWRITVGIVGLMIFGIFSGVFIGCLAMALAEILDVIPVFCMRINLIEGIQYIVLSLALGKGMGALFQLVLFR